MMLLNYNMLFGFSAKDLTPVPELATECTPTADYDDLDVHDPRRREVARRRAADLPTTSRSRIEFILDNGLSRSSRLPAVQPHVRDAGRHDADLEVRGADVRPHGASVHPDHPRAHLGPARRQAGARRSRAFENIPAVGSGPFQLDRMEDRTSSSRMEARPGHFFGDADDRRDRVPVFGTTRRWSQALKPGRSTSPTTSARRCTKTLEGDGQHHDPARGSPSYYTNFAWNFGGQAAHTPRLRHPRAITTSRFTTGRPAAIATRPTSRRSWTSSGRAPRYPADTFICAEQRRSGISTSPPEEEYDVRSRRGQSDPRRRRLYRTHRRRHPDRPQERRAAELRHPPRHQSAGCDRDRPS